MILTIQTKAAIDIVLFPAQTGLGMRLLQIALMQASCNGFLFPFEDKKENTGCVIINILFLCVWDVPQTKD